MQWSRYRTTSTTNYCWNTYSNIGKVINSNIEETMTLWKQYVDKTLVVTKFTSLEHYQFLTAIQNIEFRYELE